VDAAIAEFRQAWELNGGGAPAALTQILAGQGRLEELRASWQKILASNPAGHDAWYGYAELCLFLGRTEEYRRARTALLAGFGDTPDPQIAERTARACLLLPAEGEELRRAAALADRAAAAGPKHPLYPYFQLAKALAEYRRGRPEQAIPLLRESASRIGQLTPRLVLAMAQYRCGHAEEARQTLAAALAAHDWDEARAADVDHWIYPVLRREAEELIVPNLAAFLNGQYQPQENEERLELIRASLFRKRYLAAARLSTEVLAAEPQRADDLKAGHRYNAACAAALAGCGRGQDADKLDDKERARLRRQALDWLCADLEAQGRRLAKEPARAAANVARNLQHWLANPDFGGMREPEQLAKLPPEEQEEWGRLWGQVAQQAARARDADPELVLAQARDYILLSQWDKAAAEYAKTDLSARPLNDDAFAYACLFLIRGDGEGYDRFCQGMIQRAAQTEAPFEAYVLARSCAMAGKSPVDPARAVQWANQALAREQPAWYFHALGLAQYRAGQFDQALQSFTKASVKTWGHWELNWFGLALVHHRVGHPDEARECLAKGIQWLEREGPPGPGRPAKIHPLDWLEAQLLRLAAEEMLKIKRGP
jgi:tetratricopeptide (TPR) repeat protein